MNSKYLVSQMSKEEKTIALLKSRLYSLTVDELVKKSLDNFSGELQTLNCNYCDEEMKIVKKTKEIDTSFSGGNQKLSVINYPVNNCEVCDAEFEDMDASIYLQDLVKAKVMKELKDRKRVPSVLDFEELISMGD